MGAVWAGEAPLANQSWPHIAVWPAGTAGAASATRVIGDGWGIRVSSLLSDIPAQRIALDLGEDRRADALPVRGDGRRLDSGHPRRHDSQLDDRSLSAHQHACAAPSPIA